MLNGVINIEWDEVVLYHPSLFLNEIIINPTYFVRTKMVIDRCILPSKFERKGGLAT